MSFGDSKEAERVRENVLKKLGLTHDAAAFDAAIAASKWW